MYINVPAYEILILIALSSNEGCSHTQRLDVDKRVDENVDF